MSTYPTALWLNLSPSFQPFEAPLLRYLFNHTAIARWEYSQNPDEACSLDVALLLLHDYLKQSERPLHLIGHGTAGLLGWLYARQHPERVRSLTLLGVGENLAADWQAHYYTLRGQLPCARTTVLAQLVRCLFGEQNYRTTKNLIAVLEKDLLYSPSPNSLYRRASITPGTVDVPLLVYGSRNDAIIDPHAVEAWRAWLKSSDELWFCPQGPHFFHYFHAPEIGRKIVKFWQTLRQVSTSTRVKNIC